MILCVDVNRAPGLPLEHPECSRIFTEHGQRLWAPRHCDTSTVNRAHGTVAASCSGPHPTYRHRNAAFGESSMCDLFVVAVILHHS